VCCSSCLTSFWYNWRTFMKTSYGHVAIGACPNSIFCNPLSEIMTIWQPCYFWCGCTCDIIIGTEVLCGDTFEKYATTFTLIAITNKALCYICDIWYIDISGTYLQILHGYFLCKHYKYDLDVKFWSLLSHLSGSNKAVLWKIIWRNT
jgi:hypothetical protein